MGVHLKKNRMAKLRAYNQGKTARLTAGRISPTALAQIKAHAEELGLSLSDYLMVAEHNFYSSQPWMACKQCGAKNLIDEDEIHVQLFPDEKCRECGLNRYLGL
jgi:hypothetical protein